MGIAVEDDNNDDDGLLPAVWGPISLLLFGSGRWETRRAEACSNREDAC